MKYTDGLFLAVAREVAEEFPDIEFEDRIVDNMCMQLVQKPELYDVLVLPNLYGDILSDLAAGLVGGLGVAPGANIGPEGAVFEATHGSAPKYKGQNKVNPTALILSAVLMLRHLGEKEAADRLERAVAAVIAEGRDVTYDMKPDRDDPTAVGTREMAAAICAKMAQIASRGVYRIASRRFIPAVSRRRQTSGFVRSEPPGLSRDGKGDITDIGTEKGTLLILTVWARRDTVAPCREQPDPPRQG